MNDLSVLEKPTREVVLKGVSLKVSPLKVGQLPAFTRAIRPVFAAFASLLASPLSAGPAGEGGELPEIDFDLEKVADLITDHGDNLMTACAIAIRKDKVDIEDLEIDEFIHLVRAIIEVNADFFARAMNREKVNVLEKLRPQTTGDGPTLSSS